MLVINCLLVTPRQTLKALIKTLSRIVVVPAYFFNFEP